MLRGCGEARAVAHPGNGNNESDLSQPASLQIASEIAATPAVEAEAPPAQQPEKASVSRLSVPDEFDPENARRLLAQIVDKPIAERNESPFPNALTVAPESIEQVCEIMKLASSEGWKIVPAGAATWLDAGNLLERANVIVSTRRLNRIIDHEPADLVTITEAGATLRNLNLALGQSGQWLALDPPDDGRATIGGVVATGLGGAQQFGYGAPRRHVIGMKVVLADGSLFKTGGRVVKNVAGYDLCKLFTGSYGTLGVIVEANFRLRPLPRETRTILVDGKLEQLLAGGRRLIEARLFPVAVELLSPRLGLEAGLSEGKDHLLLVRFAGALAGVAEQTNVASSVIKNGNGSQPTCRVVTDDGLIWETLAALPLNSQRVSGRVSVKPRTSVIFSQVLTNILETANPRKRFGRRDSETAASACSNVKHKSMTTRSHDFKRFALRPTSWAAHL